MGLRVLVLVKALLSLGGGGLLVLILGLVVGGGRECVGFISLDVVMFLV